MGDSQQNARERENEDNHCHDDVIAAQNLTNFSIDEILKPDFGVKKFTVRVGSAFSHSDLKKDRSSPSPVPPESPPDPEEKKGKQEGIVWPAWVYCTRYSDRPSSGPRSRKMKKREKVEEPLEDKRPRTAFTNDQLQRLKKEFDDCRYLTEQRRRDLAESLCLTEAQIKIWFQNKRAKIKKSSGVKNPLALHLMAQGLYNHAANGLAQEHSMDMTS